MVGRWDGLRFKLRGICFVLVLQSIIDGSWSINSEGLALLKFRKKVETDPYGSLSNWNSNDLNPCKWFGVHCEDGHVEVLDLKELSLEGILAPDIGNLSHLKALILNKNHFSGGIPEEITQLNLLELLDLRNNNLHGKVPTEISDMPSLKKVLLCDNKLEGSIPSEFEKLGMLVELQCDQDLVLDVAVHKVGQWFKSGKGYLHKNGAKSYETKPESTEAYAKWKMQNVQHFARRMLLGGSSSNLAALPASEGSVELIDTIPSAGSGSFPATTNPSRENDLPPAAKNYTSSDEMPPTASTSASSPDTPAGKGPTTAAKASVEGKYFYVLPAGALLLVAAGILICMCRSKGVATIGPWKTGLSGQLQKAFVTGVPKLNRMELETACEDFSNIIFTLPGCKVFKGTLSSGVEIAVCASSVNSSKDWSKRAEHHFRKKIDVFSRVNHKNFVNLLGYCEEDEPFLRLMVFEYAPSGTLYEHLHVKEVEHLDWASRMRIIMGIAYCLEYMHHELNPPVVHSCLQSDSVFLTDDYAAKVTDLSFWKDLVARGKVSHEDDADPSELLPADTDSNVYSFGILLLEVISGKVPYTEEQGSLVNLANEYLNDSRSISYMIDPSLKAFKNNELDAISEVIQECIREDPRQRPTMKEVTAKLRGVIGISPDAATPRLSPLWWAELEILSVEAS